MTLDCTPEAIAELASRGVMRAGINLGNPVIAQRDPAGGDPLGIGPALARELARQVGAQVRFVTYETAGMLADAVTQGAWDVAFLAIDPARAVDIDFTDAYVHIEGSYMVRDESPLGAIGDVDRKGVRIAVGLKTAYDLFLSRETKHAELIRSASSAAAIDQFVSERLDAVAGVKQPLMAYAAKHAGYRVMDGNFMVIRQAAGVPRGRAAAHRCVADFIDEAKKSGFAARALKESGVEASIPF